ncbi:MAG: hypothetical protein MUE68_01195 [Bacteroidetes bacterium]|jgi:hypothetical protein|nr:hypothetical protein [Bacteroidota bacterium]
MPHIRILLLLVVAVSFGCQDNVPTFQKGLAFHRANQIDKAREVFEARAASDSADALTLAYLADSYRRTGSPERAVETARGALLLDPCLSFAHYVIAEATIPVARNWSGTNADTSWAHLLAASRCDPSDGHPWLIIWGEAIRRGEKALIGESTRRLEQSAFFTPALLNYNRWVLAGLPQKAVLLTNGDMDTYPVAMLQDVEGLRTDVVLVNRGTLNMAWYARYLRDEKGVPLPFADRELDALAPRPSERGEPVLPSDQIIAGWAKMWREGNSPRPIAFASTVDEEVIAKVGDPLQFCGAFTAVLRERRDRPDVTTIDKALSSFEPEAFFGPWVSDQDRSPVRRVGTKSIVRIVTNAALTLAEQAALRDDRKTFDRWLAYAKAIENGAELGPVFSARIRQLEEKGVPPRP